MTAWCVAVILRNSKDEKRRLVSVLQVADATLLLNTSEMLAFRFVPINKSNNFDKTKAEVTYDARKVSSPIWRISPLLYC